MKKILSILLVLAMLLAMAGCVVHLPLDTEPTHQSTTVSPFDEHGSYTTKEDVG